MKFSNRGSANLELALLISLFVVALMSSLQFFGGSISNRFMDISASLIKPEDEIVLKAVENSDGTWAFDWNAGDPSFTIKIRTDANEWIDVEDFDKNYDNLGALIKPEIGDYQYKVVDGTLPTPKESNIITLNGKNLSDLDGPSQVAGFIAVESFDDSIDFTWGKNPADEDVISYDIQYSKNVLFIENTISSADNNYATVTNLENGTSYYFRIRAIDSGKNKGEWTEPIVASTLSGTGPFILNYESDNSLGNIVGTTPQTINKNESGTAVIAVPEPGYDFLKWSDDWAMTEAQKLVHVDEPGWRQDENVQFNKTITALWKKQIFTLTTESNQYGTIQPTANPTDGITKISDGFYNVDFNTDVTLDLVPEAGYEVKSIILDGAAQELSTKVQIDNTSGNHTLNVTFGIETFTVRYLAGTGGSINGTLIQEVPAGGSATPVTAVPATDFNFMVWEPDNEITETRTDTNITSDVTYQAVFATDGVSGDEFLEQDFILNILSTSGGSVSSNKTVFASDGSENAFISLTPSGTNPIYSVKIDGVSQIIRNTYTIRMDNNHTIEIRFRSPSYHAEGIKNGPYFWGPHWWLWEDTFYVFPFKGENKITMKTTFGVKGDKNWHLYDENNTASVKMGNIVIDNWGRKQTIINYLTGTASPWSQTLHKNVTSTSVPILSVRSNISVVSRVNTIDPHPHTDPFTLQVSQTINRPAIW